MPKHYLSVLKCLLHNREGFTIFAKLSGQPNTLRDMHLPEGSLVMMIRRGNDYLVPNGTLPLLPGDALLIIQQSASVPTPTSAK